MQNNETNFDHLGISPGILTALDRMKITVPTPIQRKAIPLALEGKDIVGIAQTGTGKTLAFGIPTIQRLASSSGRALILVPTRELAIQVHEALQPHLQAFKLTGVVVIGGASMFNQVRVLRNKPRVIIATPGRLIDHLEQGTTNLKDVSMLILDEADRMFDMGFAPQVEKILQTVPKNRQTLLFSATMPVGIVKLATSHMKTPLQIEIAPTGTASEKVTQELFIVREENKRVVIKELLNKYRGSVLMFTRTKAKARKVNRMLRDLGHHAAEIHSDRTMGQRRQAIEGFRSGRYRILVATDIAARGIDVTGIELVVNYDLPDDVENYVHRIGRTGRASHQGHAVSFATPDQQSDVQSIERLMKKPIPVGKNPELPLHEFERSRPGGQSGPGSRRPQSRRPGGRPFQNRSSSGGKPFQNRSGSKPFHGARSGGSSSQNRGGFKKSRRF